MELTSAGVFRRYQEIRPRLPEMPDVTDARSVADFSEIASDFDVFFFDAFGVLNVGDTVIPGAPERIAALRAKGKSVYVVTNAATQDRFALLRKYAAMGFDFAPDEIVSSRAILLSSLTRFPGVTQWAAMLPDGGSRDGLPTGTLTLDDDPDRFWDAEGYLFLSSKGWDLDRQERLVARLSRRPCPVLVGNPDLVAPREYGLSKEPGFFAHDILDRTDCPVQFFGKPFGNAFETAKTAASAQRGPTDPGRMVMVGDTLHTDILGGAAAGIKTNSGHRPWRVEEAGCAGLCGSERYQPGFHRPVPLASRIRFQHGRQPQPRCYEPVTDDIKLHRRSSAEHERRRRPSSLPPPYA